VLGQIEISNTDLVACVVDQGVGHRPRQCATVKWLQGIFIIARLPA
jgi:hypothetical protein